MKLRKRTASLEYFAILFINCLQICASIHVRHSGESLDQTSQFFNPLLTSVFNIRRDSLGSPLSPPDQKLGSFDPEIIDQPTSDPDNELYSFYDDGLTASPSLRRRVTRLTQPQTVGRRVYKHEDDIIPETKNVEPTPCSNFTTGGIPSGIIMSPNYPEFYPPNIDCYLTVYGNAGHAVVLDFRGNSFNVEEANGGDEDNKCKYDYLEVRDGPFGFSPILGKFCGSKIPRQLIRADSGYMWLHFHTDAELQTKGFKAEIKQIPTNAHQMPPCVIGNSVTADDGHVRSEFMKNLYDSFSNATDAFECIWVISTTEPSYNIRLFFKIFNLGFPNNCSMNMVQVYQNQTSDAHLVRSLCSVIANPVDTMSQKAYVRIFLTAKAIETTNIEIVYSAYFRSKSGKCDERSALVSCGDGTCIPDHLQCNGRQNCLYHKDEKSCGPAKRTPIQFIKGPYLVILLIVLGVIFSVIICAMVLNFCPRFKKQYEKQYGIPESRKQSMGSVLTPVVSDPRMLIADGSGLNRPTMNIQVESNVGNSGGPSVPVELVYSTVVPGPNHATRLLELMPKNDVENLHMLLCRQGCALTSIKNGSLKRANSVGATLYRKEKEKEQQPQMTLQRYREGRSAPPSEIPFSDRDTDITSRFSSNTNGYCVRTAPNTPNLASRNYGALVIHTPDIGADSGSMPCRWGDSGSRKSVKFSSGGGVKGAQKSPPPAAPAPPVLISSPYSYDRRKNSEDTRVQSPQYSPTSSDTLADLSLVEGMVGSESRSSFDVVSSPPWISGPTFPTNNNLADVKRQLEKKYARGRRKNSSNSNNNSRTTDCVVVNV